MSCLCLCICVLPSVSVHKLAGQSNYDGSRCLKKETKCKRRVRHNVVESWLLTIQSYGPTAIIPKPHLLGIPLRKKTPFSGDLATICPEVSVSWAYIKTSWDSIYSMKQLPPTFFPPSAPWRVMHPLPSCGSPWQLRFVRPWEGNSDWLSREILQPTKKSGFV